MSKVNLSSHYNIEILEMAFSPLGMLPKRSVFTYFFDDVLIDTGQKNMRASFKKYANERKIDRVYLTHHHEDHVGNVPVLQEKGIPVFAHPLGVELMKRPEKICCVQRWVWGSAEAIQVKPIEGDLFLKNSYLQVIHTPGHAVDHVCFLEPNKGWLFAGDLYVHHKIKYFMQNEDLGLQIESLKKILQYDFDVILCGHNPQLKNAKILVKRKLSFLEDFYGKVTEYYHKGMNKTSIMRSMDIVENKLLKYLSGNRLSTMNMISSVVRTEQEKLFERILTDNLV